MNRILSMRAPLWWERNETQRIVYRMHALLMVYRSWTVTVTSSSSSSFHHCWRAPWRIFVRLALRQFFFQHHGSSIPLFMLLACGCVLDEKRARSIADCATNCSVLSVLSSRYSESFQCPDLQYNFHPKRQDELVAAVCTLLLLLLFLFHLRFVPSVWRCLLIRSLWLVCAFCLFCSCLCYRNLYVLLSVVSPLLVWILHILNVHSTLQRESTLQA